jgi:16S rRNA U516 pseudouridylate synthase RsuA-like enzyme
MTPKQTAEALARARALSRRALTNYVKAQRAESFGKAAREAMDRYDRQSEEAERLFEIVRSFLETL